MSVQERIRRLDTEGVPGRQIARQLHVSRDTVANARCLSEGVDVPEVDSVLFGAPKEPVTDIVWAVGRALRRGSDTDTATVIVPAYPREAGTASRTAAVTSTS